jgi:hypothetical protein
MTPHSSLTLQLAQRIAPLGFLFALLCWFRRKDEIGGWLMFFYYQIYAGTFLSVLTIAKQIGVYMPRPWKNETNHIFFIMAAIPRLLGFLMIMMIAYDTPEKTRPVLAFKTQIGYGHRTHPNDLFFAN